ncbi:hypothetical protein MBANPS3_010079 [Mucor bainieri]
MDKTDSNKPFFLFDREEEEVLMPLFKDIDSSIQKFAAENPTLNIDKIKRHVGAHVCMQHLTEFIGKFKKPKLKGDSLSGWNVYQQQELTGLTEEQCAVHKKVISANWKAMSKKSKKAFNLKAQAQKREMERQALLEYDVNARYKAFKKHWKKFTEGANFMRDNYRTHLVIYRSTDTEDDKLYQTLNFNNSVEAQLASEKIEKRLNTKSALGFLDRQVARTGAYDMVVPEVTQTNLLINANLSSVSTYRPHPLISNLPDSSFLSNNSPSTDIASVNLSADPSNIDDFVSADLSAAVSSNIDSNSAPINSDLSAPDNIVDPDIVDLDNDPDPEDVVDPDIVDRDNDPDPEDVVDPDIVDLDNDPDPEDVVDPDIVDLDNDPDPEDVVDPDIVDLDNAADPATLSPPASTTIGPALLPAPVGTALLPAPISIAASENVGTVAISSVSGNAAVAVTAKPKRKRRFFGADSDDEDDDDDLSDNSSFVPESDSESENRPRKQRTEELHVEDKPIPEVFARSNNDYFLKATVRDKDGVIVKKQKSKRGKSRDETRGIMAELKDEAQKSWFEVTGKSTGPLWTKAFNKLPDGKDKVYGISGWPADKVPIPMKMNRERYRIDIHNLKRHEAEIVLAGFRDGSIRFEKIITPKKASASQRSRQ